MGSIGIIIGEKKECGSSVSLLSIYLSKLSNNISVERVVEVAAVVKALIASEYSTATVTDKYGPRGIQVLLLAVVVDITSSVCFEFPLLSLLVVV